MIRRQSPGSQQFKNEVTEMKRLFNRYVPVNSLAPVTREYFFSYVK